MVALSAGPVSKAEEPQRIAKLLARAGIASRREIERMIEERRIALDGVALETPATLLTSLRGVTVDGNPVAAPAPARLFRFHKPAGVLTAERDPKGRRTIYDVLPDELPRVIPVGRLDLNTEGLLLLTTDGELKRQLELPATEVKRTYRARTFGDISQAQLEDLIDGIEIDGIRYGSIDANLERRTGANGWVEMTLTEGKNREVRRVLEHLGLQVSRLIRTSYGPIGLEDMPVGAVDEIRQHDLIVFRKDLRLPADKRANAPIEVRSRAPKPAVENKEAVAPERKATRSGPVRDSAERPAARGDRGADRPPAGKRPDRDRRPGVKSEDAGAGKPRAPMRFGDKRRNDAMASRQSRSGADRRPGIEAESSDVRTQRGPSRTGDKRRPETTASRQPRGGTDWRPGIDPEGSDGRKPRGPARSGDKRRPSGDVDTANARTQSAPKRFGDKRRSETLSPRGVTAGNRPDREGGDKRRPDARPRDGQRPDKPTSPRPPRSGGRPGPRKGPR